MEGRGHGARRQPHQAPGVDPGQAQLHAHQRHAEAGGVGDFQRQLHVRGIGAAVVLRADRVHVGHRVRPHEVLRAQLDPIDALRYE